MLLILCNMVVSCFAIDCASRCTKGSGVGFFSIYGRSCKTSLVDLSDSAPESSTVQRGYLASGIEVCGRHFQSGRPHPEAAHPDFTPNVQLGYPTSSSLSVRETSLQEEARQGSSESPPLVFPRIRRSERARERCRRRRFACSAGERTLAEN